MNRGGFSWKRAVGISGAKSRVSRSLGIPLTKSGRQRKIGRMVSGGGCMLQIGIAVLFAAVLAVVLTLLFT
jgi:hypothetical protein